MAQIIPIQPNQHALTEPTGAAWVTPSGPPVQEGMSAAGIIGMIRRHWMLISAVVLASVATAYAITKMTAPVYRASTTLYFADRQGTMPALDILDQMENGNNEVATEMEVMRSRSLSGVVVDSLGMQVRLTEPVGAPTSDYLKLISADPGAPDSSFTFTKRDDGTFVFRNADSGRSLGRIRPGASFSVGGAVLVLLAPVQELKKFEIRVRPRTAAIDALQAHLNVSRPNPTASVVQMSYTAHDKVETRAVPDVLASRYLAWRSSLRKSGDRSTVEFLRQQIDTISTQLYAAEESLRRFREANQVVDLPTQAQSEVQRLAVLEAQRSDINTQRTSLRSLMAELNNAPSDPSTGSPYRKLMAFPGLMSTANPAFPLLQSLTDLEQKRSDLLLRRTENDPDVVSLNQGISNIEGQIAAVVDTYLKGLDQQSSSLSKTLQQFHLQVDEVPRREIDYARLDRNATGLTQIYTMLTTRLREAEIAEAVDDGAVRVVDPAALPTIAIAPRPLLNLFLGAFIGLLLAMAAVMLAESLDRTVHTKEDVEAVSGGAVLALIPHIGAQERAKYLQRIVRVSASLSSRNGRREASGDANRLLLKDAQSVASEAFRKLRTNITFARPDSPPRVLVFTSPAPGDGKSTSVMNLAIALVQQGKRVLVVDADMRRGGLHELLNANQTPGLSEILVGQSDFESAVQSLALESFGTVDMLATGVVPPNPAELLASPRFTTLLEKLRPNYDAILIDSPPINLVTDAAIIGRETDGAVVVARAAKTARGELAHAVSQLLQVQVSITGFVLNDFDAKRDAGYSASYRYGYGYSYDYKPYGNRSS